jgi:hypothetical protein
MEAYDLSPEEWAFIEDLPVDVGFLVSLCDLGGGGIAQRRELRTLIAALHNVSKAFSGNALVARVYEKLGGLADTRTASIQDEDFDDGWGGQELTSRTMERILGKCRKLGELLTGKVSLKDVEEFKRFLMIVASKVAQASGSGFAGTGKKVSEKEKEILASLAGALGVET